MVYGVQAASWEGYVGHDQSQGKQGRERFSKTHWWGLMGEDGRDSVSEVEGEAIGLSSRS